MTRGAIVNIRPIGYQERFHAAFGPIGWPIIDSPVLAPVPLDSPLPEARDFDAVVFTSQVAVEILRATPVWLGKVVYAVGPATAEAARQAGFPHVIQTGADAKALMAALSAAPFRLALYPSAEDVSADESLGDAARIRRHVVYRMVPCAGLDPLVLEALRSSAPVLVPLFSRRSARIVEGCLVAAGTDLQRAALGAVAISAEVLPDSGGPWQRRAVADNPTLEAVVAATAAMAANWT